ncbi:hypothetical protein DL766_008628 [Monosporascus sp. MC13-8B]|uniref:Peroxin-3 n=1 Tax=Monosporascus cannonballus TaxID=155416 RepID=A0ABY0GW76_9PEZI|nr:hypothetical protein DL762_008430 [Monosporascus cannonballus]RYO82095.1 hypothetical protein DL763_008366 [Monosporascus cannonballus]RYP18695.1 hypothetical protein DL766_008628 [Monosporascus sp. MC13-8B]
MISATRRWLRRNRTPLAVGAGVLGAGYLATQYVLGRINSARERLSGDRIARENLRRRFEQNQEDCTFTVLALLPTATANVLEAMNTEKITLEIQQLKANNNNNNKATAPAPPPSKSDGGDGGGGGGGSGESPSPPSYAEAAAPPPPPSIADTTMTEEEGKSTASLQSESGVHASQITVPPPSAAGDGTQDGGQTAQKARRMKRQLWDDLTISCECALQKHIHGRIWGTATDRFLNAAITRVFTLIYTLALLTMLTRIQLNLLGRRSYLSSVISLATGAAQGTISLENNDDDNTEQAYGSDFETNRKYLTFSWWLLNRGWIEVMERVEKAVRDVFGHLSPRDLLTFDTFVQLTLEVRKKVEDRTHSDGKGSPWLPFLLPPTKLEDFVLRESGVLGDNAAATTASPSQPGEPSSTTDALAPQPPTPASLRRLLDETSDLVESPAFTHVLTQMVDAGFSFLLHRKLLPVAFGAPGAATTSSTGLTPPSTVPETATAATEAGHGSGSHDKAVMLPKILSVLTRQAHAVGSGMPNEYLREMETQVRDLEAFAAVVYSSNWENEIRQEEGLLEQDAAAAGGGSSSGGFGADVRRLSQLTTTVDESMVLVDPSPQSQDQGQGQCQGQGQGQTQSSFDAAWEKATGQR